MTRDVTAALLQNYRSKLTSRRKASTGAPAASPKRGYVLAAAVLHAFVPERLSPLPGTPLSDNPRLLLFDDVVRTGSGADGLFMLRADVRTAALQELGTREAMLAALNPNPDRSVNGLQRMWEQYLREGKLPGFSTLNYGELTDLGQIVSWLEGVVDGIPTPEQVADQLRRRSVLSSFEKIVDNESFTGRDSELAMIREHVGALPPTSAIEATSRKVARWLNLTRRPILVIHGPGGIGKSALIGRALWEHASAHEDVRIPFAYLAFDQAALRLDAPHTLLAAAASQFERQFPQHDHAVKTFREAIQRYRSQREAQAARKAPSLARQARILEVQTLEIELARAFAGLLRLIAMRVLDGKAVRSPALLALDTFEEVQYRDRESLAAFWRMLDVIQSSCPELRVLISGRGPVSGSGSTLDPKLIRDVRLPEFGMEDRVTLLKRLGVKDEEVARAVAQQVGGNPLSLRLAANVVTSEAGAVTQDGISDLVTRKWLLFQVHEELIQGQLYRRILGHLHDENVRKLAHPGMVLRRVTPEVILHVLAPLCLSAVTDVKQAHCLFEQLKREQALVMLDTDGALVYRPDIRRAMVRLLELDRFEETRQLRRAAIDWYSQQEGVVARAEEMYHRLVLGEDEPHTIDERWLPDIEASIAANLEEYPDRSKAMLASRMSLEVPREVFAQADIAEWERNITRKVQRALSELQTDAALGLLRERTTRTPASPLYALEAKTHLLREELDLAAAVLATGIKQVSETTNRGRLAELQWLESQILLRRNNPAGADRALDRAMRAVQSASNPLALIHILCHRLLIRRLNPGSFRQLSPEMRALPHRDNTADLRASLSLAWERMQEPVPWHSRFVVRLALNVLGEEFPATTKRLLEQYHEDGKGADDPHQLINENLQGLEKWREVWERDAEPSPEAAA